MIKSLNFRRPLNICFSAMAFTLILVCIVITLAQWIDIKESYRKQNNLYVRNVALFTDKYLSGYEVIVREMARVSADQHKFSQGKAQDLSLRNWLIERLRIMPDAVSIIHADDAGNFIRLPYLAKPHTNAQSWDPRKESWFTIAIEDTEVAHYSINADPFTGKQQVLTISLPVIDGTDGSNEGVLALNLDVEKTEEILVNSAPPMTSKTFLMNREGKIIINPGHEIAPETLKAITERAREHHGDFYQNRHYYFYRALEPRGWFVIQEVAENEMNELVLHESIKVAYGMGFALVVLLFCWWATGAALNTIYMRIASSIRDGVIKPGAVEELLFEEIHSSQQRHEKIIHDALTDSLTGLANRRAFDTEVKRHNNQENCHLAMIDLDNFKSINDRWGHPVGDIVLKTTAELGMRLCGLEKITLYRYGGEEIAVLFDDISLEKAQSYLEKWRISLNTRSFREPDLKVSFSAGLCKMGDTSVDEVIARADALLYKAKKSGKNKILSA